MFDLAPCVSLVRLLHRGPDGFVTLHKKGPGGWCDIGAIEVSRIGEDLPAVAKHLAVDSFFSINSMYRAGRDRTSYDLPVPVRRGDNIRWLNALFVEIDRHGEATPLWYGQLLGEIEVAQQSGVIPPASLLVRSGRGLWCLWLLKDPTDPEKPHPGFSSCIHRWHIVQKALFARLVAVRPDGACSDSARCLRTPNSLNTAAPMPFAKVVYSLQLDHEAHLFMYDLPELEALLGIGAGTPPIAKRGPALVLTDAARAAKRRGHTGQVRGLRQDLEKLIAMRAGGFQQGCRNLGAFYFALSLWRSGFDGPEVERRVLAFAAACRPRLLPSEAKAAVRSSRKVKRWPGRAKMFRELLITAEEAPGLAYLKPEPYRRPSAGRYARTAALQVAIAEEVAKLGEHPIVRRLREALAARNLPASEKTIRRLCHALAVQLAPAGRPKQTTQTAPVRRSGGLGAGRFL